MIAVGDWSLVADFCFWQQVQFSVPVMGQTIFALTVGLGSGLADSWHRHATAPRLICEMSKLIAKMIRVTTLIRCLQQPPRIAQFRFGSTSHYDSWLDNLDSGKNAVDKAPSSYGFGGDTVHVFKLTLLPEV